VRNQKTKQKKSQKEGLPIRRRKRIYNQSSERGKKVADVGLFGRRIEERDAMG